MHKMPVNQRQIGLENLLKKGMKEIFIFPNSNFIVYQNTNILYEFIQKKDLEGMLAQAQERKKD